MNTAFTSFSRSDEGLVTCKVYEDGDVVVCHGRRGNVENMKDVSGYGPLINMCERLDLSFDYEQAVIAFVDENDDLLA